MCLKLFETVYSVWDYYDGPRSGIADVRGEPCYFSCEWDEGADDWAEYFTLKRLATEALNLALEGETIWRNWEGAFHRGEVPSSTHPALPEQNARYVELTAALDSVIDSLTIYGGARAAFRVRPNQPPKARGILAEFEVEWLDLTATH